MPNETVTIVADQSPQVVGHTPGPWHVEPAPSPSSMKSIRAESGKAVAFVNRGPAAEANERLISTAPDLLASCRELRAVLHHDCGASEEEHLYKHIAPVSLRASAAIAKAEGGEP